MSIQLHRAVTDILAMPYFKNEHAHSGGAVFGHEEAVALRIKSAGFIEIPKSQYPALKKKLLKKWAEGGSDTALRSATAGMPLGSYILQPAGSQGFPDILVKDFDDRFIAVECKSGQTGLTPMWNDNLPKPDTIYVLSSGVTNSTTIFMGRDVITDAMLASQVNMVNALTTVVKQYQVTNAALDQFNRGWDVKFRPQNFQSGGQAKTNYFTHVDRTRCEQNALTFAQG